MAVTCLPTIPFVVLGVLEPVLLIWAYIQCLLDPTTFYQSQVPPAVLSTTTNLTPPIPPQGLVLTLQVVNVYALLAAMALICCWTTNAATAKWYCFAVALADYGHIWACYRGVGPEVFWDPLGSWNDMLWGGVGASAFLNLVRWGTLVGVFGRVGGSTKGKGKGKGKRE
ncbi:hypothetical protein F4778DRAFT_725082 [Xylariomycetidae sp. FL2044]|nr:hypothetical protein F4778DRAFT_725082 [Xylariomycetidae sp. FL2044]